MMLKLPLVRELRVAPDPKGGLWVGGEELAVRFPVTSTAPGRVDLPGWARDSVLEWAEAVAPDRLRLELAGLARRTTLEVVVVPDPGAVRIVLGDWEPVADLDARAVEFVYRALRGRRSPRALARLAAAGRGLVALEVAGERTTVRGEFLEESDLIAPAQLLRRAAWAGLREGWVTLGREAGRGYCLVAAGGDGTLYCVRP